MFAYNYFFPPKTLPNPPIILLTLTFPPTRAPTRDTVQTFEQDWQLYGPGSEASLALEEQTEDRIVWKVKGLEEWWFGAVGECVGRWVREGVVVKAWMEEEEAVGGGALGRRRWELKA